MPGALLLWTTAFAQLAMATAVFAKRENLGPWMRRCGLLSLATVAFLLGLHLQVALHIVQTFTPIGAQSAWALLGTVALALPW